MIRFLFGAGEAGWFPNATKAFTMWLPGARSRPGHHVDERPLGRSLVWIFGAGPRRTISQHTDFDITDSSSQRALSWSHH